MCEHVYLSVSMRQLGKYRTLQMDLTECTQDVPVSAGLPPSKTFCL